jgi:IS5 family transposase
MARRRIGQEDLVARQEPRAASSLAELAARRLDWAEVDRALVGISAAAKGRPGWPPLALFRGLLLATWLPRGASSATTCCATAGGWPNSTMSAR